MQANVSYEKKKEKFQKLTGQLTDSKYDMSF